MKNNFKLIILILSLLLMPNLYADEFIFETEQIDIINNGKTYKASNGKIITNDKLTEITGKYFEYDRVNLILKVEGNVNIFDLTNKTNIQASKIIYYKKDEKIITDGEAIINTNNNYIIKTKNLIYLREKMEVSSNDSTLIRDELGNKFLVDKFLYKMPKKVISGDKINYLDTQSNNYLIEKGMLDLSSKKIVGKDLEINFDKSSFGNSKNEPRLKGRSIYSDKSKSIIKKGIFTTCKKREKCPPWAMSAEEVVHDKDKKIINYKKAWLKVYDKPVFYFPKFFHPDPTVKRQSGFLFPTLADSNKLGMSLEIPYYHVIAENKDLTFKPRIFEKKNLILQSEYRQVNKNSEHILDFSLNKKRNIFSLDSGSSSKTHFFSNSLYDLKMAKFEESNLEINLQHSSNDTYLKTYKIDSPLITNTSTLNSYVNFDVYNEDLSIETSFEVYENLENTTTDRFEYIYPNFTLQKNMKRKEGSKGEWVYKAFGYQKTYSGDNHDKIFANDFLFNSDSKILESGVKNNFSLLLKNINTDSENSTKFKNHSNFELLGAALFEMKYPLNKFEEKYDHYLTPIASFRYSPSHTKNIRKEDRRIDINNIHSFNRIASNDAIEGGASVTLGSQYLRKNKKGNDVLALDIATNFRNEENKDLPISSTIGNKTSDIVGGLSLSPSKYLNLNYNFSVDNDLSRSNYDEVKTTLSLNNFVTTFEFLETKNYIGNESYISNETQYSFNETNRLKFGTRKNKKTDLVEYYNLIYEYNNDCLVAAIEYNKEYYNDSDLEPEEQLFFTLTIVPFGKTSTPNINK
tara:strand:- start:85 stop:2490 length:2406 start_codon:yes stop_codon:yes gene_type:complete